MCVGEELSAFVPCRVRRVPPVLDGRNGPFELRGDVKQLNADALVMSEARQPTALGEGLPHAIDEPGRHVERLILTLAPPAAEPCRPVKPSPLVSGSRRLLRFGGRAVPIRKRLSLSHPLVARSRARGS